MSAPGANCAEKTVSTPHPGCAPVRGETERELALSFEATPAMVESVLLLADEWAAGQGAHKDERASLRLILEELLINICLHSARAEQEVELTLRPRKESRENGNFTGFSLVLRDFGPEFNPLAYREKKLESIQSAPVGGRGLTLVRLLAEKISYQRTGNANVLLVELAPGGGSAGNDAAPPFSAALPLSFAALRKAHGLRRALALLWRGSLAVRQTAFFFTVSLALTWGGLAAYRFQDDAAKMENAEKLARQSQHTQDVVSSTFLERIARNLGLFVEKISALPNFDVLLEDDDAFYLAMKSDMFLRALTAEIPVLGVLKGKTGQQRALMISQKKNKTRREIVDYDFDDAVIRSTSSGQSAWVPLFSPLPGRDRERHASMFIAKKPDKDNSAWFGIIITMPWIAETITGLSGFEKSLAIFLTDKAEYVICPPGRSAFRGPRGLDDEALQGGWPKMADLASSVRRGEYGLISFDELFAGGPGPWPMPWNGPSTLIYSPMTVPGWRFMLFVSSDEIGITPKTLPMPMVLLAVFGPALIAFLAWLVTSRTVEPLRDLSSALERIGEGDIDTPIPGPRANDEIAAILRAFEHVRVTLKVSFANLEQKTEAQQKLRDELALARSIQESMLPSELPRVPGLEVAAHIDMAGEVCGDLFDCFTLPHDREHVYFLVGDVCGKGIPASMIMSRTMSLARSALLRGDRPGEVLARLNDALLRRENSMMFVTMLVARLNCASGLFSWASAGHPPPILGPSALHGEPPACATLPWPGELVMGVRPGLRYSEHSLCLAPGQMVLLYTDGAEEAMRPIAGAAPIENFGSSEGLEIFGEDRLAQAFGAACRGDAPRRNESSNGSPPGAQEALDATRAAILEHMAGLPPFDDISLMAIRRTG